VAAVKRFFLCAVIAGALFGMGLVLSCMTDPERVIVFLDVFGDFDPTLAFVLGGSVLVTVISFRFILRMRKPALAARFELPQSDALDAKLISGATLFGVGWGLAGYCPGPAIAGLAIGSPEALWFVSSMVLGSAMYRWAEKRSQRRDPILTPSN
jgi:uncharacterized membrane protein YedE/YeeE